MVKVVRSQREKAQCEGKYNLLAYHLPYFYTFKMEELISWSKENGGNLSADVEVFYDSVTGHSFRVREGHSLIPGDAIVSCPLSITLSYLNTLDQDLTSHGIPSPAHRTGDPLPREFLKAVAPHVTARFFLMQQYLLGRASFWYPYIRTLPQPDNHSAWALPPFWTSDDIDLLEGTNAHVSLHEIKARLRSEHKHASAALEATSFAGRSHEYSRLLYHWAYTIFTTRSFRPSRVVPDPEALPLPDGVAVDDFHVLMPLFDVGNHSPTAEVDWHVLSEASGAEKASNGPATVLATRTPYAAGEQVFNNYGPKTNAELLLAYGFVIPASPALHNDYVHLQLRTASAAAPSSSSSPAPPKPRDDFFFSLRPVTHPSSVTAHKRLTLPSLDPDSVLPCFRHVQDTLVWELVCMQTSPEQREALFPAAAGEGMDGDKERLRALLTGEMETTALAVVEALLERTLAIIQAKAFQELEKLEQSDFELDEDEDEDDGEGEAEAGEGSGATRNQRLAYVYRTQCRNVLINVLESLEMPSLSSSRRRSASWNLCNASLPRSTALNHRMSHRMRSGSAMSTPKPTVWSVSSRVVSANKAEDESAFLSRLNESSALLRKDCVLALRWCPAVCRLWPVTWKPE
ncbi:SET domain-containing protein [Sodiomyces alkalinus F11]|uniref:SET domain-containing protein n=1 Tax=Sodiomyces alkalinus (strain CBS 110278 / VKM F-3762 / F11) TaxID=1314773 RepID=A0A3N2PVB6_SODAK|nr:SET domain-containing protein [Sodiomyces alkalinus F11]ROT38286.1 SET domain-containing protein [Sodiomyces alkalinus F11]